MHASFAELHRVVRTARANYPAVFDLILSLYQIWSHVPVRELRRQLDDWL